MKEKKGNLKKNEYKGSSWGRRNVLLKVGEDKGVKCNKNTFCICKEI